MVSLVMLAEECEGSLDSEIPNSVHYSKTMYVLLDLVFGVVMMILERSRSKGPHKKHGARKRTPWVSGNFLRHLNISPLTLTSSTSMYAPCGMCCVKSIVHHSFSLSSIELLPSLQSPLPLQLREILVFTWRDGAHKAIQ